MLALIFEFNFTSISSVCREYLFDISLAMFQHAKCFSRRRETFSVRAPLGRLAGDHTGGNN
jgi:hypothetical protein